MYRTRIAVTAFGACTTLLLASCGDDVESLTKPEFISQANEICQTAQDATDPIFERVFADLDDVDWDDPDNQFLIFRRFGEAIDEARPALDKQFADLRALEPPKEDKELLDTLLDDTVAAVDEFSRLAKAGAAGDEAAMEALDDDDPMVEPNRRAREYGLTVCGEDG